MLERKVEGVGVVMICGGMGERKIQRMYIQLNV